MLEAVPSRQSRPPIIIPESGKWITNNNIFCNIVYSKRTRTLDKMILVLNFEGFSWQKSLTPYSTTYPIYIQKGSKINLALREPFSNILGCYIGAATWKLRHVLDEFGNAELKTDVGAFKERYEWHRCVPILSIYNFWERKQPAILDLVSLVVSFTRQTSLPSFSKKNFLFLLSEQQFWTTDLSCKVSFVFVVVILIGDAKVFNILFDSCRPIQSLCAAADSSCSGRCIDRPSQSVLVFF